MSEADQANAKQRGQAAPLARVPRAVRDVAAGLWFAGCMTLAFPPFGLWYLCLFALVGPALALRRPARWTAVLVGLGTLPFWAYEVFWTARMSALGYVPFALALTAYAVLALWIMGRLSRRWPRVPMALLVPIAWGGVEMLRGRVAFDGYAWYFVGHPTIEMALSAFAGPIIGAIGVSVFVAAFAGAIADLWLGPRRIRRGLLALVISGGAPFVLGFFFLPFVYGAATKKPGIHIGVVQTNVPQSIRGGWTLEQRNAEMRALIDLGFEAIEQNPDLDLLVWPETMFPGLGLEAEAQAALEADGGLQQFVDFNRLMREITFEIERRTGVPLLVGATGFEGPFIKDLPGGGFTLTGDREFNSAFLLERGEIRGRYDKVHLTPFGEVMPYISKWPWLERQLLAFGAAGMAFDLSEGDGVRVLELSSGLKVGTPICFEIANPAITRRMVNQGANVIVTLTNDGWFGSFDAGRQQHLDLARWRAIETGLPVVRAANTGISCMIDKSGVVTHRAQPNEATALSGKVTVWRSEPTVYTGLGDLVGWLVLALAGIGLAATFIRRSAGTGRRTGAGADE